MAGGFVMKEERISLTPGEVGKVTWSRKQCVGRRMAGGSQ